MQSFYYLLYAISSTTNGTSVFLTNFDAFFVDQFLRVAHRIRSASVGVSSRSSRAFSVSCGKIVFDDDVFVLTPFVNEGLHTGTHA